MPAYMVQAINISSFDLGEADRVLGIFTAEKGLLKAVAKAARKPGTKMAGRSDILAVNELLLAHGRTFEIITQAQSMENFPGLRKDLTKLSYGLFYAELTNCFAQGLEEDSKNYFEFLVGSLRRLSLSQRTAVELGIEFQMGLLEFLGLQPELTFCIYCREVLHDYNLAKFNVELGGVVCTACFQKGRRQQVSERSAEHDRDEIEHEYGLLSRGVHITPLVWKSLALSCCQRDPRGELEAGEPPALPGRTSNATNFEQSSAGEDGVSSSRSQKLGNANSHHIQQQSQRLLQAYVEHKAGKKFKSLDFLAKFDSVRPIKAFE